MENRLQSRYSVEYSSPRQGPTIPASLSVGGEVNDLEDHSLKHHDLDANPSDPPHYINFSC